MDERRSDDPLREDAIVFVAEGIVGSLLGVAMDVAVVTLADMAVVRGRSLVEMARDVVAGAVGPRAVSRAEAHPQVEGRLADPDGSRRVRPPGPD